MRNYLSPPPNTKTVSYFNRHENCDCDCHCPDDCDTDYLARSVRDNNLCFSPSPLRPNIKNETHEIHSGLCVCDKICNCPCHCISCVCCPCVKERQDPDTGEYYRNLYFQIKSELELEKKRNERMKYSKQMHENNIENSQKEKEILLTEIEQLKSKLAETMDKLKNEAEKNMARDDELFTFKQEEVPKIQDTYEKMIKKIKDDYNKQINYLNNQLSDLSKENMELKLNFKKKVDEDKYSLDNLADELGNENNELKMELENRDQIIEQLKNENEDLNNQLEELSNKLGQENNDLKNQNLKLNQTIKININEIKKLKDDINKLKKDKSMGDQTMFTLKSGNENKNNEINSLKKLLIQKEEEIDGLTKENEQLKNENNNLNLTMIEINQH